MGIVSFFLHMILVENMVLSYGLGIDLVLQRKSSKLVLFYFMIQSAVILSILGLGFWILYHGILVTLGIEFLGVMVGLLMIVLADTIFDVLKKRGGRFFFLSSTENGTFFLSPLSFGFLMMMVLHSYSLAQTIFAAVVGSIGLGLVGSLIYHVRNRMRIENIPEFLRGGPMLLLILGIVSLGFSLFDQIIYLVVLG